MVEQLGTWTPLCVLRRVVVARWAAGPVHVASRARACVCVCVGPTGLSSGTVAGAVGVVLHWFPSWALDSHPVFHPQSASSRHCLLGHGAGVRCPVAPPSPQFLEAPLTPPPPPQLKIHLPKPSPNCPPDFQLFLLMQDVRIEAQEPNGLGRCWEMVPNGRASQREYRGKIRRCWHQKRLRSLHPLSRFSGHTGSAGLYAACPANPCHLGDPKEGEKSKWRPLPSPDPNVGGKRGTEGLGQVALSCAPEGPRWVRAGGRGLG